MRTASAGGRTALDQIVANEGVNRGDVLGVGVSPVPIAQTGS